MSPSVRPCASSRFGLMCLVVVAFAIIVPESAMADAKRICGPELVKTMSMVCDTYPTMPPSGYNKRTRVNDVENDDFDQFMNTNWPYKANFNHFVDENYNHNYNRMYQSYYPKKLLSMLRGTSDDPPEVPETKDSNFRMVKRGIVEECCHKPCTYEKMREFCAS